MATNIPPHNLGEVVDGLILLLDNPDIDISELMKVVIAPDFPTGAIINGIKGIRDAYTTGRGTIKVRSKTQIEEIKNGRYQIIVNELPYLVNKARLVEKIAELVREKKIEGITDLRDESDRTGIRIVIETRKDISPQIVRNSSTTYQCETFGVTMLADSVPRVLNLKK